MNTNDAIITLNSRKFRVHELSADAAILTLIDSKRAGFGTEITITQTPAGLTCYAADEADAATVLAIFPNAHVVMSSAE